MSEICVINRIRIVLVEPSHPGNIGASARAMKTMGLSQLILVSPKQFPDKEAIFLAAGADDLLEKAVVTPFLSEALTDCEWVIGVSVRQRKLTRPLYMPRACAEKIARDIAGNVAIVFGRESSGLTNEELALCHDQVCIPANSEYSSLNLAAAVQVITYECRIAALSQTQERTMISTELDPLAGAEQVAGFYEHLRQVLIALHFIDPRQPKRLMERLQLLFNRAHLTVIELNILRGILSAVEKKTRGDVSTKKTC